MFFPTGGPAIDCCEYVAMSIADLKLLVNGGCRVPIWEGDMLEPCCLVSKTLWLGMDNTEPKARPVARWRSPSRDDEEEGQVVDRGGDPGPIEPVGGRGYLDGGEGRAISEVATRRRGRTKPSHVERRRQLQGEWTRWAYVGRGAQIEFE